MTDADRRVLKELFGVTINHDPADVLKTIFGTPSPREQMVLTHNKIIREMPRVILTKVMLT